MRLADYLNQNGIRRYEFAARIGVSPGTITAWCDGLYWPARENAERIFSETKGAVTPNDFLNVREPERAAS